MTSAQGRQSTPLSVAESVEETDGGVKKSRKRKVAEKKPVPLSATLRGFWGKAKSTDEGMGMTKQNGHNEPAESGDKMVTERKVSWPLVFKIDPAKLAAPTQFIQTSERMITPPRSLPDIIPETPIQTETSAPKTPISSRGSGKKRSLPQSPPENVRRSPRNHRGSQDPLPPPMYHPILPKPPTQHMLIDSAPASAPPVPSKPAVAKKPHPFFMGKEARTFLRYFANVRTSVTNCSSTCSAEYSIKRRSRTCA